MGSNSVSQYNPRNKQTRTKTLSLEEASWNGILS